MTPFDKITKLFKNKQFLDSALTHKSWVNEHPGIRGDNERLEFLGDAVLEYIVSSAIFERYQDKEEGFLTALRASVVNTTNLARIAKDEINLGNELYLSKGEDEGGGRNNPSLLANTMEAIIGALYLDRGIKVTEKFILDFILTTLIKIEGKELKDPKSLLQEKVQAMKIPAPKYKVIGEIGPDHDKTFKVEVIVDSKPAGIGQGKSKLEAEQVSANNALVNLNLTG